MLANEPVEYSEPDQDNGSREALVPDQESNQTQLPSAPPPERAVQLCPVPGQVCHSKWRLTMDLEDYVDIFHTYAAVGNDESIHMQLKFWDSRNPSVFVNTPNVDGNGLNLTAANHAVITQKFWVLNDQLQAFAWVVCLGQNRVPHTWLLNIGPGDYENCVSDLHQHSGVAQLSILHSLISQQNIIKSIIC